ncbi:hypothetical protein CapIbe_020836 [Capra ibex]
MQFTVWSDFKESFPRKRSKAPVPPLERVKGQQRTATDIELNSGIIPSRVEKVPSNPSEKVAADLGNAAIRRGQAEQGIRPCAVGWQKWRRSVSDVVMCWKSEACGLFAPQPGIEPTPPCIRRCLYLEAGYRCSAHSLGKVPADTINSHQQVLIIRC